VKVSFLAGKAAWAPKSRVSSISEEPAPFRIVLGARNSLTSRLELRFPRSSASWWNSIFAGTNLDFTKGRNLMSETQRKLSGKSTLITGASAGIGQACARALAAEGARLVLTARRQERLDVLAAEVQAAGSEAKIVVGDAREEETARQATAVAKDSFGGLDILINNTGVGNYKNLVDTSAAEYDEMMDTNVRSTFLFTRHPVPLMLSQRSGTILMISSMAGVNGFGGEAVYCMTKFAQVGFAQAPDKELRSSGIKVGAICPGGREDRICARKGADGTERSSFGNVGS
jgi:NAD(P)-dependent dehydrogenase (short-subunit alcohol dehydrogenase family)